MNGTAILRRLAALHLQTQFAQLLFESGNLLLLTRDDPIQLFEQIFAETQLDFDFGKARVHGGSLAALFRQHNNLNTMALHGLPGTDFCGLAIFRPAIDDDFTIGHQMFALSAAFGDAGEFEQIAEPDMFTVQVKLADFQGIPVVDALPTGNDAMILELYRRESAGNPAPAPHSKPLSNAAPS